jgi:hypothetical protein
MDEKDQALITALVRRLLALEGMFESLVALLRAKNQFTDAELRDSARALRSERHAAAQHASKSRDELLEEFLQEFEGRKQ